MLLPLQFPPPSKANGIKIATFCEEFSDYLEKMSCASGNVLIVGDFNIDFMDSSAYEYNKFINILDTFDFIQHIDMPTHSSGHLLDYIITRKDNSFYPTSLFLTLSPTIGYCMPQLHV